LLFLLMLLVGCSGGNGNDGGGNSNGSILLPSSTYAVGSIEKAQFDRLNQIRLLGGFGEVHQDPQLDMSVTSHAGYIMANGYVDIYKEVATAVGFTGVDATARYAAQGGVANWVTEYIDYSDSLCIDNLSNNIFFRALLLTSVHQVGIKTGYDLGAKRSVCVLDFVASNNQVNNDPSWVGVYPGMGQTGVQLAMPTSAVDPAPSIATGQKGSPVSMYFGGALGRVDLFILKEAKSGAVVPTVKIGKADFPSSLTDKEIHLIPTQLLATDTTYTASFSGVLADGTVVTKEWSFSTVASNLKTSVPAPSYAAGSIERIQFDRLNQIRLAGGFGAVPQDPLIDQSALNHADYLFLHYYDSQQPSPWSSAMDLLDPATNTLNAHIEVVGASGFTGVISSDRLAYVGRNSSAGEVISFREDCIDDLLNSIFHRDGLLDTSITGFGIGLRRASNNQDLACVVEYSTSSSVIRPTGWVGLYPMPGQTGVPLGMVGGEAPDPAPSVPNAQKGSPVTIYLNTPLASVTSFTLRDAATSAMVPVLLLTKKEFPGHISDTVAHILPAQLLTTDTTYTASFSGVLVDGTVVTKEWSFSTVASNLKTSVPAPSYAAGSVEKFLFDRLNQVRQAGGFGMVPQDGLLDQSAKNHAAYALVNDYDSVAAAWRWATISFDTEVSGAPGFTGVDPNARYVAVGGVSAARELTAYNKDIQCVDDQLNSVFQRRRALSTDVSGVGFGFSYAANRRDSVCFIDYTSSTAIVAPSTMVAVYPTPNQTGLPMGMAADAPDPAPSIPNAQKGLPVSIFLGRTLAQVTSFTLHEAATSTVVPVVLVTQKDFPSSLSDREAHIVPTQQLATGTTYTASFSGVLADGSVVNKVWSFTTEPIVPINIALSPAVFSGAGSTIQVSASGGNGNLSISVWSFYSYYGGVDPGANFSTNAYLNPHTMVLTRNSTACTPGVLVNCSVDVTVIDSMGNKKVVSIPVN
jgi:uncharacterized protein YkwD